MGPKLLFKKSSCYVSVKHLQKLVLVNKIPPMGPLNVLRCADNSTDITKPMKNHIV